MFQYILDFHENYLNESNFNTSMFSKKKCKRCGEKVKDDFNYCPYCNAPLKDVFDNEDWGMLGRNDLEPDNNIKMPFGLNALFNSLLKDLNNQMQQGIQNNQNQQQNNNSKGKITKKQGGISISISTSGDKPPEIKVRSFGNNPGIQEEQNVENVQKKVKLPVSDSKKFSGLPKKEPLTNIRRLSNKVVYEIKLPGVKNVSDLSIVQLESSIEIKALAGKKVFYKIIPINLPINSYNLSNGVLTLELDSAE
jgi:HSP20 family molecular chaperone IbpA